MCMWYLYNPHSIYLYTTVLYTQYVHTIYYNNIYTIYLINHIKAGKSRHDPNIHDKYIIKNKIDEFSSKLLYVSMTG